VWRCLVQNCVPYKRIRFFHIPTRFSYEPFVCIFVHEMYELTHAHIVRLRISFPCYSRISGFRKKLLFGGGGGGGLLYQCNFGPYRSNIKPA
jgi:hypothetical protein